MKSNRSNSGDLVQQFEEEYDAAFTLARKAAETTATDGWQAMYIAFLEANSFSRNSLGAELEKLAERLKHQPLDVEDRKQLKKLATSAADVCDNADSFDLSTVEPIRGTVQALTRIVADYENAAARDARQVPLIDPYIEQRMAEAIQAKPRAAWNPRVGCVTLQGVKV